MNLIKPLPVTSVPRTQPLPKLEDLAIGKLRVRMAKTARDLERVQALRYQVFFEEMGAEPCAESKRLKRDIDHFDDFADHLMVIDSETDAVVGTYRFLSREKAQEAGGFYSANEFDLSAIEAFEGNVLELGRSCVHQNYRSRQALQLLWRAIAVFVRQNDIDILFGCASFAGTDAEEHATGLSYLYHHHLTTSDLHVKALDHRYVSMNTIGENELDAKSAFLSLPILLKGYLRVGGMIGDGAVIDPEFNTTDVFIVVKCGPVIDKYVRGN